jgi:hypothetical protein
LGQGVAVLASGFEIRNDVLIGFVLRFFSAYCHGIALKLQELVSVKRQAGRTWICVQNVSVNVIAAIGDAIV